MNAKEDSLLCYYDVQDVSSPTRILNTVANIKSMRVDGVQATVATTYQFSSLGEHFVEFYLNDKTFVNVPYARGGTTDAGQFRNCPTIRRCYFPKSVTNTAQTFRGNSAIEYINFSDSGLQNIGNYAFQGCSNLTGDLEIPFLTGTLSINSFSSTGYSRIMNLGKVETLDGNSSGAGCFGGMGNLTFAELPSSLKSIKSHVFWRCRQLNTIICRAIQPPTISGTPFKEAGALSSIYVPDDSVDSYKEASGWSAMASIIKPLSQYEP